MSKLTDKSTPEEVSEMFLDREIDKYYREGQRWLQGNQMTKNTYLSHIRSAESNQQFEKAAGYQKALNEFEAINK